MHVEVNTDSVYLLISKSIMIITKMRKTILPDGESNPGLPRTANILTGGDTHHYTTEDWISTHKALSHIQINTS